MPGDRIPHSVLPSAEIGTAPVERSMAEAFIFIVAVALMATLAVKGSKA
jgi:hypothetical protein